MSLVLKAGAEATDDYHVMHGDLKVGQIYKRKAALRPEAQWLWALNGVQLACAQPTLQMPADQRTIKDLNVIRACNAADLKCDRRCRVK